jgi:Predicted periplasmic or secreted lipoprotein
MKGTFLIILFLIMTAIGCSRSTAGHPPEGITASGGAGTTGTTETGGAAPAGTTGTASGGAIPGQIIPAENNGSKSEKALEGNGADEQITSAVRQKLQDANISLDQIQITTKEGVVTLQGKVADQTTADSIIAKVKEVSGVKDVRSSLEVSQ